MTPEAAIPHVSEGSNSPIQPSRDYSDLICNTHCHLHSLKKAIVSFI